MKAIIRIFQALIIACAGISPIISYSQPRETEGLSVYPTVRSREGMELPDFQIEIREILKTQYYAMIQYVFFDEGSSEIPFRYEQFEDPEDWEDYNPDLDYFDSEILNVYYDMLNIIGYRLRKHEDKTITLIGCNSNKGVERGNIELSRQRAEAVKEYFTDIWEIEPNRIFVEARNLPEFNPSVSKDSPALADEENRRVEIEADWEILKPLTVVDTTYEPTPPRVFFNLESDETNIAQCKLEVRQGKRMLDVQMSKGFVKLFIWKINREQMPRTERPVKYQATLYREDNTMVECGDFLEVDEIRYGGEEYMVKDGKQYERFNLILFEFKKSELSYYNKKIIELIMNREIVDENTEFSIFGFTDSIGVKSYNYHLSRERCDSTKSELIRRGVSPSKINITPLGESKNPYKYCDIEGSFFLEGKYERNTDNEEKERQYREARNFNDVPEGRFYLRTVIIEVKSLLNRGEKK